MRMPRGAYSSAAFLKADYAVLRGVIGGPGARLAREPVDVALVVVAVAAHRERSDPDSAQRPTGLANAHRAAVREPKIAGRQPVKGVLSS
jgi:hypothetical protein